MPRNVPTATTCPGPVACLAAILRLLVGSFIDRAPVVFPPGALVQAVWRRIHRLGARLRWLSTTTPPRAAPAVPGTTAATTPPATPPRPRRAPDPLTTWRITHEHGWLVSMMPGIGPAAAAFEEFLRGPGADDLLAADPRYAGLLHRLGWMLGVNPDLLPPPLLPEPPPGPLAPTDLRPAPPGYPRTLRVNQLAYEMLEARQRADAERALDLAAKNA